MEQQIFTSLIQNNTVTVSSFTLSIASAFLLGAVTAFIFSIISDESKSFLVTLAILPPIVALVIMMVNGSLGASVAVAGAFSLVRFRSNPGTAREISAVFLAMAIGLACGVGYPVFAAVFAAAVLAVLFAYERTGIFGKSYGKLYKTLKVTIPEDLEYNRMFDDIFDKYTESSKLIQVRTANLGSLMKLTYEVTLKNEGTEKALIDELRVRNGNLEIGISSQTNSSEL